MALNTIERMGWKFERNSDGSVTIVPPNFIIIQGMDHKSITFTSQEWCEIVTAMSVARDSRLAAGMHKYLHNGD